MSASSRFLPSVTTVDERLPNGDTVLVNLATCRSYSLNATGTLIWQLLNAGHRLADFAAAVSRQFDVPAATAEADVRTLLEDLLAEGLLDVQPG
ncbi:MAG: PqqD family protein [Chloroflexota bacterium]